MPIDAGSPLARLQTRLEDYRFDLRIEEQGSVVSIGDGIAWVRGLPSAAINELLDFGDGSRGIVFHLGAGVLGAVLIHQSGLLTAGTLVNLTGRQLNVPVGDALQGRIVDPIGLPLDSGGPPECPAVGPLERPSPPIIQRDFVSRPLYTGIKIIDAMIPIGMGQRQLIIGDQALGRSAIAIDAVINQRERNVQCVYVLIGQKRSAVVNLIETLKRHDAMDYTTIVVAEATALPGLQYLAPFAGCAIAEYWMRAGKDTLVVFDDLSTHARAYRELSLLLRRPPGREAYPGDIFFLHARLLERATCLAPAHGGGSMTALAIVETLQGEIASYIPTNLISITDGQIYLDANLFAAGFRPAIDVTRSVSRIGGKAQHRRIKEEAGRMKLDYLQFLELEVFTRFGARLEASMQRKLQRGQLLRELLKQDRLKPHTERFLLAWLIAFNHGLYEGHADMAAPELLDSLAAHCADCDLGLDNTRNDWLAALREWLPRQHPEINTRP